MDLKFAGIFFFLFILFQPLFGVAPSNDDCSKAYLLRSVSNYCSSPQQFTNEGATASGYENPGCFTSFSLEPDNDVWFKFTAIANTVNISVLGAMSGVSKGTLQHPQFALYRGSCNGELIELACISDPQGYNIAETFITDLAIGGSYYIRVDGRQGKTGTFQLCVNNFNPVPSPSSDCATAVVLCDKSPFTVPSISGVGYNNNEIMPGLCVQEESSSAWYKWTCDKPGSLTFTLKPVNPSDDIDFALFYLPNGVEDCASKIPIRCMASGEDVNAHFSRWARCSGSTGLRFSSYDTAEFPGCADTDDNFISGIVMEAGDSYALLVNNFHNTGNGFSIEFGGSGTFKGPEAHFVVNKLKIHQEQDLWVRNKSNFDGGIKKYEWNFGVDAKPGTAKGIGPHKVSYSSSGRKSISLVIETENGCQVTKVRQITVTDPPPPPPPEPEPAPELVEEPAPKPEPVAVAMADGEANPMPDEFQEKRPILKSLPKKPEKVLENITYDVKYTATIYFASDSSSLESDDMEVLRKVLEIINQNPEYKAIVEGHTNNIPDSKYCNKLASERAAAVITWLKANGVPEDRIIRKVFGKEKVYVKEEKKFQNRRMFQKAVVKVVQRE